MKSGVLAGAVLLIVSLNGTAAERAFFDQFVGRYDKNTPKSYTCRLSGSAIDGRLQRIPPDAVQTGKKPVVMLYYADHLGQAIKVLHVDAVFENLFSMYNRYLSMTGSWITGKGRNWEDFSRKYALKILRQVPGFTVVRVAEKTASGSGYAVFHINRYTLMIHRALFYYKGQIVYQVENTYRQTGRYLLPAVISVYNYRNGSLQKKVDIRLEQYRINVPVSAKNF